MLRRAFSRTCAKRLIPATKAVKVSHHYLDQSSGLCEGENFSLRAGKAYLTGRKGGCWSVLRHRFAGGRMCSGPTWWCCWSTNNLASKLDSFPEAGEVMTGDFGSCRVLAPCFPRSGVVKSDFQPTIDIGFQRGMPPRKTGLHWAARAVNGRTDRFEKKHWKMV